MRGWGIGALALVAACYSMSTLQEPKPLPPGGVRGSVGVAAITTREQSAATNLQLALRVGVVDRVESRLKLAFPGGAGAFGGVEAGFNVMPVDSKYVGLFLMPHYRYYRVNEDFDRLLDETVEHQRRVQAFAMPTLAVFHVRFADLSSARTSTRGRASAVACSRSADTSARPFPPTAS